MDGDPSRLAIAQAIGANVIDVKAAPKRHGNYWVTADTSGHPSGEWLATALNSTAPYGRCTSCGIYHVPVPLGAMYRQGVRFTIGWANIQALMPKVLDLLSQRKIELDAIHTVASWQDGIEALKDPRAKLIIARDEAMRAPKNK